MNTVKIYWFSFWYAVAFLTRIPAVNLSAALKKNTLKISQCSLYFYPLVGMILGSILFLIYAVCTFHTSLSVPDFNSSNLVIAALIVMAWCITTGGLHIDGLADAADAWVGGYGDKQRTMDIMKDPTVGPMGLMLVVLVLLLKFSALVVMLDKFESWRVFGALMIVPMLARFSIIPLFYFTPYVREKGLGSNLKQSISPIMLGTIATVCTLLSVVFLQQKALLILILMGAILLWARNMMLQRIGGTTGDTAGALIEVQETLLLAALVL